MCNLFLASSAYEIYSPRCFWGKHFSFQVIISSGFVCFLINLLILGVFSLFRNVRYFSVFFSPKRASPFFGELYAIDREFQPINESFYGNVWRSRQESGSAKGDTFVIYLCKQNFALNRFFNNCIYLSNFFSLLSSRLGRTKNVLYRRFCEGFSAIHSQF